MEDEPDRELVLGEGSGLAPLLLSRLTFKIPPPPTEIQRIVARPGCWRRDANTGIRDIGMLYIGMLHIGILHIGLLHLDGSSGGVRGGDGCQLGF